MRDYRRLLDGVLFPLYLCRHPDDAELAAGIASGEYVLDTRIAETVESPVPDVPVDDSAVADQRAVGLAIADLDRRLSAADARAASLQADVDTLRAENTGLRELIDRLTSRRIVRMADGAARMLGKGRR